MATKECPEYTANHSKRVTWGVLTDTEFYDTKGKCCCNCQNQRPICAHPWNKSRLTKGSIMKTIGWGCAAPDFFPKITFMDREHGFCECYTERTYEKIDE